MSKFLSKMWFGIVDAWSRTFGHDTVSMHDTPIYDALEREWARRGWAVVGNA